MVDFEKIGKRILEERKYLRRISQEKMAEDLGMYQADISNLEKAKSGSGITDLAKLDMIADYFDMPLETLLFGRRQDQMEKYYGSKMQLKEYTKKRTKKHDTILRGLMGIPKAETASEKDSDLGNITAYDCGPYRAYVAYEVQREYTGEDPEAEQEVLSAIVKVHIYVLYQDEVIGCMTVYITTLMQHIYQPVLEKLKMFIQPDIFDVEDTLQILNPYWLLYQYPADEEEEEQFRDEMLKRMDELRGTGENRKVMYVENAYVREDCRRNGILRLMLDTLKKLDYRPVIWLCLEPTSGEELNSEYSYHAVYQSSELGQINMNASIAERLGFTVDFKTVDRQAEHLEEDGTVEVDTVPVRRTAYLLPKKVRNVLNGDGDLLANARARAKTFGGDNDHPMIFDVSQSAWKKYGYIISIKLVYRDETVYAFARGMDWKSRWLGVSLKDPGPTGEFVETLEKYNSLQDAVNSRHYIGLKVAEQLLGAIYFGTVKPEDVMLDELTAGFSL